MKEKLKKKSFLKESAVTLVLAFVLAAGCNFLLQLFQNQYNWSIAVNFTFVWHTQLFLLGTLVIFILSLWLTALIGNRIFSFSIVAILTILTGFITQQKMLLRGEPFYPSDMTMISELPFLLRMIGIPPLFFFAAISLLSIMAILLSIFWRRKKNAKDKPADVKRKVQLTRLGFFLLFSFLIVYIGMFNRPGNLLKRSYDQYAYWIPYSQQMNYYNNGFVGGFLYNMSTSAMLEPDQYSKTQIESITEKYKKIAEEINHSREGKLSDVNIIYIMNESFSDPLQLDGLTVSEDPIPETRAAMERYGGGDVLSQGFGGGTANIEFEALTGLSMEPMASSLTTPYTQLNTRMAKLPSLAAYLSGQGYETIAIHPYNTTMYKRKEVYESLDFGRFIDEDSMDFTETIGNNPYISDESAYNEILSILENTEAPSFIHLVTMQNHMGYIGKYPDTRFSASGSANNLAAANYFQDLSYSDQALKRLLEALEASTEKTIVVFWGDHLPSVYGENIEDKNDRLVLHQTPLLIYSNFNTIEKTFGTISPIYFANHIFEAADAEVTPYHALLMELEKALPAFEKGLYLENDSDSIKAKETREELSPETLELLEDYEQIQYDVTTGKNYSQIAGFFD